ncbi:hypothetical protein LJ656_24650 [Paraburkholderia sp. MMS20-SJTR3]|uniref:Uncharacterized protein n=1 Tax=Paraburkholderia sejongensis TaxID=2886946 RepID=A0ABS8K112_9BURK|nr:hypothetical protein [Paraburkholderia sp. MMS20-SJTR3]MCC8395778.1 hypothetical protein [Paraburkholderia sp. MMS20-SJTR3]
MNRFGTVVPALAAFVIANAMWPAAASAQMGMSANRQMQDTQRAAQKKARKAKSEPAGQTNKTDHPASAPAAASQ